jgi:hypothetical protein
MPDLLLGDPNKAGRSRPVSPHRHSILILINAADDSAPIFGKRLQCMSMEDRDAHTRHHSTGIPQEDRSHVVGA